MTSDVPFNEQEALTLVEQFQNQDFHQYSYSIIRKTLAAKQYDEHEPLIVNALMEVMNNVLDNFKEYEADREAILKLSGGLYKLLMRVECVEADPLSN